MLLKQEHYESQRRRAKIGAMSSPELMASVAQSLQMLPVKFSSHRAMSLWRDESVAALKRKRQRQMVRL
jgi:hypothetical protein